MVTLTCTSRIGHRLHISDGLCQYSVAAAYLQTTAGNLRLRDLKALRCMTVLACFAVRLARQM